MIQKAQRCHPVIGFIVLMALTVTHCQENERRSVTEHQLMHDRGRSIQSLKRLIWLSSAMEGLHTAHTHTPSSDEHASRWHSRAPLHLLSHPATDSSIHQGALEMLLTDMYRPYLPTGMGDGEK
uniref:Parathyroid hormone-like hormone b n=1 Tax=Electrophorus electricus TaxID=8005 RepID=A0A4W4G2D7_ELEEL